jgi:hypothetical protein
MKRLLLFPLIPAALCLLSVQPAQADPLVPPVTIHNIMVNGTGCPPGTVTADFGPNFFEVLFSQFVVQKPGPPSDAVKACTVAVDLDIPPNYQFTFVEVHYEGYAQIPSGMYGDLRSQYSFPLDNLFTTTDKRLNGPFDGPYAKNNTIGVFTPIYSWCGGRGLLNMKATLSLSPVNDHRSAVMTVDLQTGRLRQVWAIDWSPC